MKKLKKWQKLSKPLKSKSPWIKLLIVFLSPLIFLILAVKTIPDYGINWDEAQHFNRGYAYLHYFLTGEKDYTNIPQYKKLSGANSDYRDIRGQDSILFTQASKSNREFNPDYRRSYFQSDTFNYEYFIKNDSGHPPLNGILAAFTNYILYQKLNLIDDIESFHLFEVFVSFLLIAGVGFTVYKKFGIFPSIVSSSSLGLYPLFFGESHFNIKDPIEASFFGLTIITTYFAVLTRNAKIVLLSGLFFGLALGTKFNALFIPLILLPWFIFYFLNNKENVLNNWKFFLSLLLIPLIGSAMFFLLWPFLWENPLVNSLKIFKYYSDIGIQTPSDQERFIFLGINTYPFTWILFTTPIPILILTTLGLYKSLKLLLKKDDFIFLILIWFLLPIVRVSLPGTNIYGGVRQIMEFLPAMAILSGIGAYALLNLFRLNYIKYLIILGLFFVLYENFQIHPNQNVYFNQLIGGLSGAKATEIPSWGNSFGNAYYQGIKWINQNAETNAKLGLPIGTMVNIPRIKLREDINFSNEYFSGYKMLGEYQIELSHDYPPKNWFSYSYLDKFLNPVYEVQVDNVAIAKVWKNDPRFLKKEFSPKIIKPSNVKLEEHSLVIDLKKTYELLEFKINLKDENCSNRSSWFISLSEGSDNWVRESETLAYPQMNPKILEYNKGTFFFLFPAKKARYIKLNADTNLCFMENNIEITVIDL